MAVLLTRAEAENARFARQLDAVGIAHLSWPLAKIDQLDTKIELQHGTEAIVFTSANGVRAFAGLCAIRDLPALCVGDRTTEVARQAGFADAIRAGGTGAELLEELPNHTYRRLYYPRAEDISKDLRAGLPHDFELQEQIVYAARPTGPPESKVADALASGRIAIVTIWSRRNAQILEDYLTNSSYFPLEALKLVAISENASEPLNNAGFERVLIARTPDASGMLSAIFAALRQDS